MKHNTFQKTLAVFMAVTMLVTGCAVYAYASDCDHSQYTSTFVTVSEPDCSTETNGLRQRVCDNCGDVFEEQVLEWQYAHDYSGKEWIKTPTCTERGEYNEKCAYCGKLSSYIVLTGTTHDRAADEIDDSTVNWFTDIPAGCTQPGLRHAVCKTCGETVASNAIEALGHVNEMYDELLLWGLDPEEYIGEKNVAYKAPTCTETGSITFNCDVCGDPVHVFELEAKGHYSDALDDYWNSFDDPEDYAGWPNVDYKPATCTEAGSVAFKCDTCLEVMRTYALDPLGHDDGVWKVDVEPTADHEGYMSRYCSRCHQVLESKTVELHKHRSADNAVKTLIQPTCTTEGEKGLICDDCGAVYATETVPALGHDYGSWYKNNNGTHSRGCSRCQYIETANCSSYVATVTAPTCEQDGFTTFVCADCGHTYTDNKTEALDHDWGHWTDDENDKTHTRVCGRCKAAETDDHHFTEWEFNHDATLFKSGTKSCKCKDCGLVKTEKAKHTSWICQVFYPVGLWLGSLLNKTVFIASLAWLHPFLNLKPEM